jgi:hypothetical protein
MLLPDGLRSSIVTSYGRGELTRYAESLLDAVKLWRQAGAWRSKREAIASKKSTKSTPLPSPSTALNSPEARTVILFVERWPIVARRRRFGPSSALERPATSVVANACGTRTRW